MSCRLQDDCDLFEHPSKSRLLPNTATKPYMPIQLVQGHLRANILPHLVQPCAPVWKVCAERRCRSQRTPSDAENKFAMCFTAVAKLLSYVWALGSHMDHKGVRAKKT